MNSSTTPQFTVFTPTWNRAHTLPRVYASLCAQTHRDFEWLIVDDGSTDNTRELVGVWQAENRFPLRYEYQQNAGKHIALNRGAALARGELFLNFDSDDSCEPHALERFAHHWNRLSEAERANLAGITALCCDENGTVIGEKFPTDALFSTPQEMRFRWKIDGEKWGFVRSELLRRFPFPQIKGVKWVDENIVWFRIGTQFRTLYINATLRTYRSGDDQITHAHNADNASAIALIHSTLLNTSLHFFPRAPLSFLRSALNFTRFSLHSSVSYREQWRSLEKSAARALWLVMCPFATLIFWRDTRRKRARSG